MESFICCVTSVCCLYACTCTCFASVHCLFLLCVNVSLCCVACACIYLTCVAIMQTQIVHLEDAHGLLDEAVAAAIRNSKPVYISVCCNLAGEVHPSFSGKSSCTCRQAFRHSQKYTALFLLHDSHQCFSFHGSLLYSQYSLNSHICL